MRFNPRAREGRDILTAALTVFTCIRFNPRAREGRDQQFAPIVPSGSLRFNPRAREGRDTRAPVPSRLRGSVSIHAPVKGATVDFLRQNGLFLPFQSTRP